MNGTKGRAVDQSGEGLSTTSMRVAEVDMQCLYMLISIDNPHISQHPESLLRNMERTFSIESPFSEKEQMLKFHGL